MSFTYTKAIEILSEMPPRFKTARLRELLMEKLDYCNVGAANRALKGMKAAGLIKESCDLDVLELTEKAILKINELLEELANKRSAPAAPQENGGGAS